MEVIFIKDLKGQGKKGEIKKVKDGYGQNYLIKNGYAVLANDRNKKDLDSKNKAKAKEEETKKIEALKLKEKLDKEVLEFKVKVGSNDKVFGSISTKQLKESLDQKGYKIEKKQFQIENSISTLGVTEVKIILHPNVIAKIKVHLAK